MCTFGKCLAVNSDGGHWTIFGVGSPCPNSLPGRFRTSVSVLHWTVSHYCRNKMMVFSKSGHVFLACHVVLKRHNLRLSLEETTPNEREGISG